MQPTPHRSVRLAAGALLGLLALAGCSDTLPTESRLDVPLAPRFSTAPRLDETPAGHIRIGVIESASSVSMGADGAYDIVDKATGGVLASGSDGSATVTLASGSVSESWYRMQVMCSADVSGPQAAAEAAGYETYTEPVPNAGCTRLYLGRFAPPPASTFSARVAFKNQAVAAGHAPTDAFWRVVTTVTGVTRYEVAHAGGVAISNGPVVLRSASGIVQLGGKSYRGLAEVRLNAAGTLAGVNETHMEDYLKGVVPRELPPVPYGEVEAQKAQAVAARTYAYSGMGKRKAEGGYDLRATTSDQVYGGYAAEHPVSSQAVDETSGVVAVFGGRLIEALFSSTSGGHTAGNEEAYNSSPVPYLRGVPDAQRGRAMENVPSLEVFRMHGSPAKLRGKKEGDYESDWSKYHRWTFEWTMDEITRVVSAYAGVPVGRVLEINVTDRGPSGRVLRIEYVTEAGTFVDTKDRIRSSLKYINASGGMSSLLSTLFFIEPVVQNPGKVTVGYRVYGGGWGHGVGLSQTGAVGMAEKGATYEEILKHFYRGIDLETR